MSKVAGKVFGGGGSPGALGTGRFTGTKLGVKEESFKEKLAGAGTQEDLRVRQEAQTTRLEETAEGKRPSLAEAQLKAATSRSLAQQVGASQARRGGSAAARERQLSRQSGKARREVAETSAVARIQEQQAAEQQLASQLAAQRAQDIGIASEDRASQQRLQELLVQENLGVQGLNLSGFQSAATQRSALASNIGQGIAGVFSDKNVKTNIKSEMGKKEINASKFLKAIPKPPEKKEKKQNPAQSAALIAAISDKKSKRSLKSYSSSNTKKSPQSYSDSNTKKSPQSYSDHNVKENRDDFNPKNFLDALKAYSYNYKDSHSDKPEAGRGRFLSVMAQDLENAGPVGKSMVEDTPEGKMVNYGKGFGAILAAQAHLNERLSKVEKSKKKKRS